MACIFLTAATAQLLLPGGVQAQGATKQGQEKQKETEKQKEKPRTGGAIDETEAAAEALRLLLERLKKGEARPGEKPTPGKEWSVRPKPAPGKAKDEAQLPAAKPAGKSVEKPQEKKPPVKKPEAGAPEPRAGRDDPHEVVRQRRTPPTAPEVATPRAGALRQPRPTPDVPIHASASLRHRYRRAAGRVKQDTIGLLAADVGDANHSLSAHLLARGFVDSSSRAGAATLDGFENTRDHRATGRLYDAHVDWHGGNSIRLVRIGRQTLVETPEVMMLDGVAFASAPLGGWSVALGGHAGLPAHLFESSPSGDLAAGAHVEMQPRAGTRVRLDAMHVEDRRRFVGADNQLASIALWHQLDAQAHFHARYSMLEGRNRDLRLLTHGRIPDWDLGWRLHYEELFEQQGALATEFDPFNQSLLAYFPYRQVSASVTQNLSDSLSYDAGVVVRRLARQRDEGPFNRDFDRAFLAVTLGGSDKQQPSLTFDVDAYSTGGNDTAAAGIELRAPLGDRCEVGLGSIYSLYKYDAITQRERDDVRTWFGRFEYRPLDHLTMSIDYAFETGPFPDSHSAEARMSWRF